MTNVVSEKLTLPVLNGQKDGDGQYLVTAILSNSTVETGFFPKEVALFAKCGDGEEILYSYSNGGNNVGLIPDKNTPINSEIYNIRNKNWQRNQYYICNKWWYICNKRWID